jgi:Zn-dependent peptidase ImmA (M78 family)
MEEIPYKNYEEIRKIATGFLAKYHPSGGIPIPIEEIIEFQLKLNIIPIPGLRNITNIDGADAFTYRDQGAIAVDEYIQKNVPNRYRFTLAHEIGHRELHREYFSLRINSVGDWKEYAKNLAGDQHSIMEYQANCFAGLVLVPGDKLKQKIPAVIEEIKKISPELYSKLQKDFIWDVIKDNVASYFEVSKDAIHIRMERDKLYRIFDKDI